MPSSEPNGWGEWSRHVLAELKRLNSAIEGMTSRTSVNEQAMIALETKMMAKNDTCVQHFNEIVDVKKGMQKNRDMIMSHRLITAAISAFTSLATAAVVAYVATRGVG